MLSNNFIDVIKTLGKDEFKKFLDFVNSPYHNSNKSLIKLAEVLKKNYPDFSSRNFTKEKIYHKVFSSGAYNDQVMRNLMSDGLKLVNTFLPLEAASKATVQNSLYLLRELRLKKLTTLYEKNLKSLKNYINEEHNINFLYFESLYNVESEIFLNELTHNRQEIVYPTVIKQSEYITYDYLSKLINHLIDMSINEQYFHVHDEHAFAKDIFASIDMEKILETLKNKSEKEYTVLSIFYYRAMTILAGKEEYYEKFKKLFFENAAIFERGTNHNLITSLETFCINNIKHNPEKYRQELHDTHLKGIALNIIKLEDDSNISLMRFWNIFINSIETGKIDWAEKFVKEFSGDLDPEVKQGATNFAESIILYKRKDYDKALEKLNKARISQYLFRLSIKTFYLRIYYEKGDLESASFALDSYKQFLYKNKKISESYREGYLNFASVYNDLLKANTSGNASDKTDLQHKLNTIPQIYNKLWLNEMLEKISG
jgi:hypothetical protein